MHSFRVKKKFYGFYSQTLYLGESKCPKYEKMLKKLIIDPESGTSMYEFNRNNKDLFEYLTIHMGQNVTNIMPPSNLYDTLYVQESNGLELPAWTAAVYPHLLYDVRVRSFDLSTETEIMKRIRSGSMITRIYNQMAAFERNEPAHKIITYSAHDTTIANALSAMNITGQTDALPSYGSLLAFELHGSANSIFENTVQVHAIRFDCFLSGFVFTNFSIVLLNR